MSNPTALIVDDQADVERGKFPLSQSSLNLLIRHPDEVTKNDLESADVVVVDFLLDEPWQDRDNLPSISLKPLNGLALLAVLKSHERLIDGSATAFALRSAHLGELTDPFTPDTRLHLIARQNGLEWVLNKNADITDQMQQIVQLAKATEALPPSWPKDNPQGTMELVQKWLGLPDERWRELAWQDIEDCHPPIHELDQRKHGLRLVRWMSQQILPYPCFLSDEARLATRLGVTLNSLLEARTQGLDAVLAPARYTGALCEFDGKTRWWKSGLESVLWDITDGRSFDLEVTINELNQRSDNQLKRLTLRQPVLCLDRDFRFASEPCELEAAIRIQPDDWPVFAEQAWAALADASDEPRLAATVIVADRERLVDAMTSEEA